MWGIVTPLTKIERCNRGYRPTKIDCAQAHSLTGWNFSPKSLIQLPMTYLLKMSKCQPTNRAHYHIDASEELSHENPAQRAPPADLRHESVISIHRKKRDADRFPSKPPIFGFLQCLGST
jgi:hypothetical protein